MKFGACVIGERWFTGPRDFGEPKNLNKIGEPKIGEPKKLKKGKKVNEVIEVNFKVSILDWIRVAFSAHLVLNPFLLSYSFFART